MYRTDNYPPGFDGHPLLYLITLFSMLLTVLLALEWLWRITWAFFERPFPLKHPASVHRIIFWSLMIGLLIRIGPDVWLLMRWPTLTVHGREQIQQIDGLLDATSFVWMSAAWLIARLGDPIMQYQLEKQPLPIHLWPTARQLKRPLYIGIGVFLISFALTFLR